LIDESLKILYIFTLNSPDSGGDMNMNALRITAWALICLSALTQAAADPVRFHTTADEMVRELTRPVQKYRSFVPKKRSIVVMEKKNGHIGKDRVIVDNSVDTPRVRTKILFDFNSARVRPESRTLLSEVGTALNSAALAGQSIVINGHADSDGPEDYNLALSFSRGASVRNFLVQSCQVKADRLKVRGFGESMPLVTEVDATAKQQNRRVEFELVR